MNFGNLAKKHTALHGLRVPITQDHATALLGEGTAFTPKKLEKANAAREKLNEQLTRKWKLDD